ncbi:thioredoxin h-type [Phtheirospermum japonicum]|uniref:Thioredoxin n=1 Tax=Phtheirospermum japonicum TaxID=374723 RepID=A0A830BWQ5_9LAMI|nr:thioredoxin h-type [Phtheirospermum japonicum]
MEKWEKETSEANSNGKIVVVNFSASWCSPCRQIAPAYRELADKYSSHISFLTVDVDELVEFSTSWDIQATPTFFLMRDGRQVDKVVGANKAELQKKIATICELT